MLRTTPPGQEVICVFIHSKDALENDSTRMEETKRLQEHFRACIYFVENYVPYSGDDPLIDRAILKVMVMACRISDKMIKDNIVGTIKFQHTGVSQQ